MSYACLLGLRFLIPTPNARKEETVTQQILWDFLKSMMIPCVRKRRRKTHQVCVPLLLPLPISRVRKYNYGISGRRCPDYFQMEKRPLFLREAIGGGGGRMIREISTDTKLHFWLQMHDFLKKNCEIEAFFNM